MFGGQASRDQFEMATELNLQRAHQYWDSEIAGSNPLFVRYKRLVFRVPHYKTLPSNAKEGRPTSSHSISRTP